MIPTDCTQYDLIEFRGYNPLDDSPDANRWRRDNIHALLSKAALWVEATEGWVERKRRMQLTSIYTWVVRHFDDGTPYPEIFREFKKRMLDENGLYLQREMYAWYVAKKDSRRQHSVQLSALKTDKQTMNQEVEGEDTSS